MACLTPGPLLQFHLGYEPSAKDRRDMQLLSERCGLELRAPYTD